MRHVIRAARRLAFLSLLLPGLVSGAASCGASEADPPSAPTAVSQQGPVVVLEITGAIGPATAGYVTKGLESAAQSAAQAVVLRLDTPGGLSASMREIVHAILQAPQPVIGFVAPRGARAASAGTYILYATHVAAMAPGTTLGAATPVQLGGDDTPLPAPKDPAKPDDGAGTSPDEAQEKSGDAPEETQPAAPTGAKTAKAVNDAVAYIRALAELRSRNAEWAERAVREAATLTVEGALARNVIDLKARDLDDLLAQLDGRVISVGETQRRLATAGAPVQTRAPDWRDRLLAILTDPNVAFILMTLGIYGLIFELSNPGALVPGVLGGICLTLGLYAMNVLPVNYAGLALLALGVAFMTAEAFAPSFGVLGLGGLAAFALGATILFDTEVPGFTLSLWTVGTVTAVSGGILVLLLGYLVRAQRRPVVTGHESLIGACVNVEDWQNGAGHVRLHGEVWHATGPPHLEPGATVTVRAVEGLTLTVAPPAAPAPALSPPTASQGDSPP